MNGDVLECAGEHDNIAPKTASAKRGKDSPTGYVPEVLLTRRQVAERWQVCEHTVARNRNLKPIRLNRRLLRYHLSDVEAIEK